MPWRTSSSAALSCASSARRPTKGASARAGDSARFEEPTAPVTSNTSTGSASPLTFTGPRVRVRTRPAPSATVSPVASTVPGLASCSIRDATCTVCPTADSAPGSPPTVRSTTSPEFKPTRI